MTVAAQERFIQTMSENRSKVLADTGMMLFTRIELGQLLPLVDQTEIDPKARPLHDLPGGVEHVHGPETHEHGDAAQGPDVAVGAVGRGFVGPDSLDDLWRKIGECSDQGAGVLLLLALLC